MSGFLIVPAFRQWTNIRMHSVAATSLLVVALVSIAATFSVLGAGAHVSGIGASMIGTWPAVEWRHRTCQVHGFKSASRCCLQAWPCSSSNAPGLELAA